VEAGAPEGYGTQVAQHLVRGAVAPLAGGVSLAAGNFSTHAGCPAREAGDVFAFVGEVIGPQLLRLAE